MSKHRFIVGIVGAALLAAGCDSGDTSGDAGVDSAVPIVDGAVRHDGAHAGDMTGMGNGDMTGMGNGDMTGMGNGDMTGMGNGDMAGMTGSDGGISCAAQGTICVNGAGCCSGFCDPTSKTCTYSLTVCQPLGATCAIATDCCSLTCINKLCGPACTTNGTSCKSNGDCCSGFCNGGNCAPVATGCTTTGNKCSVGTDCCSTVCMGGLCAPAGGGCQPIGDVCYSSTTCCSGNCVIPNGMPSGTCQLISHSGCTLDGEVCPGCSHCCSRVCATTVTGASVCQPAGGCRLLGDICLKDSDCCGGPQTAQTMCSIGEVTCQIIAGSNPPIGQCSSPNGNNCGTCNPEGDVCGIKPVQACSGNAREDCCDCPAPDYNCCKFDTHGVARCFGGGSTACPTGYTGQAPCCIDPYQFPCSSTNPCPSGNTCVNGVCQGQPCSSTSPCPNNATCTNGMCPPVTSCTFADECCGGLPCVPDSSGVLRCQKTCQAAGAVCTATSDCCTGLTCIIKSGEITGVCGTNTPPPDMATSPSDMTGVPPDMAVPPDLKGVILDMTHDLTPPPPDLVCPLEGQHCSTTTPCCSGLNLKCTEPGGILDCTATDTNCSCTGIIG